MAGEVSKDITRRILLPDDVVTAHDKGIIHFHDADYFAQHMHNCALMHVILQPKSLHRLHLLNTVANRSH